MMILNENSSQPRATQREGTGRATGCQRVVVKSVSVAALAKFLEVRHREVKEVVAIGGIIGGNVVAAFDGMFTFVFLAGDW